MVERFRRYWADTIGHTDRTTDGQSDSNIPPYIYMGVEGWVGVGSTSWRWNDITYHILASPCVTDIYYSTMNADHFENVGLLLQHWKSSLEPESATQWCQPLTLYCQFSPLTFPVHWPFVRESKKKKKRKKKKHIEKWTFHSVLLEGSFMTYTNCKSFTL